MEDYKIIVYIVLAILYFLFSGKKKKKAPPVHTEQERKVPPVEYSRPEPVKPKAMESRPAPAPAVPEPQPYSLEDILREFGQTLEEKTGQKHEEVVEKKPVILEEPVRKIVDYDKDLKAEEASLEIAQTKSHEPLSEKKEHLASYPADAQKKTNKYAAMFADPEGVRTAFVAGEIFNRKY